MYEAVGQCVGAVEGCRGRTQCEERCEYGEHMCSPLHYRLPDTTQQHQTHHGYSYPSSSHLSSHWVRALQPSTAPTHCLTASYPLQHFYNTLQSTALQQFYNLQPLHLPSGEPPAARPRARPPQRSRRHWFEMQDPNSVQVTRVADAGPATHSVHVGPGVQNPSVTQ